MMPRPWQACVIAAAAVAAAVPALAADLPPGPPEVSAPVATIAPPPYSWYGFFIGIQGGYGFGGKAITYTPNAIYAGLLPAIPGPVADGANGFIGGISYGTNLQFGRLVVGTESDWSYSDINIRNTAGPIGRTQIVGEQSLQWFATSRGRAGVLVTDQWLLYGTGGLASASVETSSQFNLVAPGVCAGVGNCPSGGRDKRMWGWAAGGGMEFASGPWSVKLDYLYYDLGKLDYAVTDPTLPGGLITASNRVSGHLVRGGINYRFNWTPFDLLMGRW